MGWYSQDRRKRHLRQGLTRPSWRSAMSGRHPVLSQRDMLVKFGDIWGWYRCRWHWDIIIMGYIQTPLLAMICPFCRAVQRLSYHAWGGGSWRFLNYCWPLNFGSKIQEEETSKKIPEHPPLPERGHVSQLVSFLVHFFFNFGHAEIIFWACRFQIFGVEDVFLLLDVAMLL